MFQTVYNYKAKVLRIIDGDTIDISVDLGFGIFKNLRARLWGINAPELARTKTNTEQYLKALQAKIYLEDWIKTNTVDNKIIICSHDGKALKQEKYGRWLVEVYPVNRTTETKSLNDMLLSEGLAVEFMRK